MLLRRCQRKDNHRNPSESLQNALYALSHPSTAKLYPSEAKPLYEPVRASYDDVSRLLVNRTPEPDLLSRGPLLCFIYYIPYGYIIRRVRAFVKLHEFLYESYLIFMQFRFVTDVLVSCGRCETNRRCHRQKNGQLRLVYHEQRG